jgi:hypothetical protein
VTLSIVCVASSASMIARASLVDADEIPSDRSS